MPTFASTDAPRAAIPIKNHRYQIPRYPLDRPMEQGEAPIQGTGMLQNWTRASTIVDTHKDKENLIKWRSRLVAKGMGDREDLVALAAAARLADRTTLNSVADQAFDHAKGQAASNLGSALHGFLERTLNGERDLVIPDRWQADVAGVLATFQDLGIKLNAAHQELVIVRPDLKDGDAAGLAGRFDLLGEYRGKLTVIDYKTGSDPLEYGAWEIQQKGGLYATGWAVWDGEFWHPMPEVRDDLTLMVHVLPGRGKDGVTVHEVDLDVAELELDLAAAYRTRARRKAAKKAHRVVTGDDTVENVVTVDEVVAARVTTPDMLEQERKRDERLAAVDKMAKATDRNDDPDDEGPGAPAPGNTCDCEGDGDWHPPAANCAKVTTTDQAEGKPWVPTHPASAAILNGEGKPLQPEARPGERGCSVCGRKGHRKGGKACLGDADPRANGQDRLNEGEPAVDEPKAHTHGAEGWTRNPLDGLWYCGTEGCDQQAALAVQDELTADQESTFPGQVTPAELEAAAEEPDPFGDAEEETAELHAKQDQARWLAQLNGAESKAEIREIRARATTAGQWNDELLQAGLARIKTFK